MKTCLIKNVQAEHFRRDVQINLFQIKDSAKKVYNLQNIFWLMFFKNVNMKDKQFLLWKIVLYY